MTNRVSAMMLVGLLLALAGCAPALRSNRADLDARAKKIKSIVLLPPKTKICELSAGGIRDQRDDWCATGRKNVEKAIIDNLSRLKIDVKVLPIPADQKNEVAEIMALYGAVKGSIYTHTYNWNGENPNLFPDRVANFDYSIGSVEKLLRKQKADGLLLVHAKDEISTSGRKALRVVQALNPFAEAQQGGTTEIEVSLTDCNGDILWHSFFANSGRYDLRDPDSTRTFVKVLLDEFPGEGR